MTVTTGSSTPSGSTAGSPPSVTSGVSTPSGSSSPAGLAASGVLAGSPPSVTSGALSGRAAPKPARRHVATWARVVVIVGALLWALIPLAFLFMTSIKPADSFLEIPPRLFPRSLTLDNFREAFDTFEALRVSRNSLVVTSAVTVISVLFGVPGGYALHRLKISPKLVSFFIALLLFVRFYPRIAAIVPWFLSIREIDQLDTRLAIVLGHIGFTVPLATWLMHTAFRQLPPEFDEAARIDGANVWQRLTRVQIPLAVPAIASAAVLSAFLSWNEFLVASSTTRESAKVLSITTAGFITDKGVLWGPMAAVAILIIVPPLIFALSAQKYVVRGLTGGGLKG